MGEKTGIAWTHSTFNPWIGCTKIGPGCDLCYAEAADHRFYPTAGHWGAGAPRKITSEAYWRTPLAWEKKAKASGQPWRVFCASQADVFDNEVEQVYREALWSLISETPHLTWLLLTKRIGNVKAMLPSDWGTGYSNVWLGATVVNQQEYDRDMPKLAAVPAYVRWLSMEPQIEHIVLNEPHPDWVVSGGESGALSKVRNYELSWPGSLLFQCRIRGVPFFMKQLGTAATCDGIDFQHTGKGDDMQEWPHWLRVREFPVDVRGNTGNTRGHLIEG